MNEFDAVMASLAVCFPDQEVIGPTEYQVGTSHYGSTEREAVLRFSAWFWKEIFDLYLSRNTDFKLIWREKPELSAMENNQYANWVVRCSLAIGDRL